MTTGALGQGVLIVFMYVQFTLRNDNVDAVFIANNVFFVAL